VARPSGSESRPLTKLPGVSQERQSAVGLLIMKFEKQNKNKKK